MTEKISIDKIRTARKTSQQLLEFSATLKIGTKIEILYPKEKDPVNLEIALDSDPTKGKILQQSPLALAIAEHQELRRNEPEPNGHGLIEFGPIDRRQKVTLVKITEPTSQA